jgi:hypothetical protein
MSDAAITPSVTALKRTAWDLIDTAANTYAALSSGFSGLADVAKASKDLEAAASCRLLANISSLTPDNDQIHDPYAPMARWQGRRSFLPDDMTNDDLDFIASLLPDITSPRLAARCADILWIRKHGSKPYVAARAAVDAWLTLEANFNDSGHTDVLENWPRYLRLARQLKFTNRLEAAHRMLGEAFWSADSRLALNIVDLLLDTHIPDQAEWRRIADHLVALTTTSPQGILDRELHVYAARMFNRIGDLDKQAESQYAVVKWWTTEAEKRSEASGLSALSLYQSALQDLRAISKVQRERLGISRLVSELTSSIRAAGVSALGEMRVIESEGIDLRAEAEQVQELLADQDAAYATCLLVSIVPYMSEADERTAAEDRLSGSVFLNLASTQHLAGDGRVVGNTSPEGEGPWGYAPPVWLEMIRAFDDLHVQWAVKARVLPALDVITLEHRIRLRDCEVIARCSPIVPTGREYSVARALAAGFNHDFAAALYMLTPQLEHIVRTALNDAGVSTTTISDRVEQEKGLSSLLESPELSDLFTADVVFELRALFGGPIGANLRNEVAHGLLSDRTASSGHAIYAWYFFLRLVYIPYWNGLDHEGRRGEDT